MWWDAFRPDASGVPQKAAQSNPCVAAPKGRGATHRPALSRASMASGVDRASRALWQLRLFPRAGVTQVTRPFRT
jgi:hypothetical protein